MMLLCSCYSVVIVLLYFCYDVVIFLCRKYEKKVFSLYPLSVSPVYVGLKANLEIC